ncbi:hypothetical protein E4U14_008282 [Claviceps sp. LM454 group G7]|nr:hypothetical protein E4U14_008282 [Claviceps sp. LM454 group G7]
MHALSLLAVLLPLVAADMHKQCDCWSFDTDKWEYNTGLTNYVCDTYYGGQNHLAVYDDGLGRCLSRDKKIDGDEWETLCKISGQNGYYPITPQGLIDLSGTKQYRNAVYGHCL